MLTKQEWRCANETLGQQVRFNLSECDSHESGKRLRRVLFELLTTRQFHDDETTYQSMHGEVIIGSNYKN